MSGPRRQIHSVFVNDGRGHEEIFLTGIKPFGVGDLLGYP